MRTPKFRVLHYDIVLFSAGPSNKRRQVVYMPGALRTALPIHTLRPPAEAPDWLPNDLPDSAEVVATSNWLVPMFQSTFRHLLTRPRRV
jgi:hypothetical protein